MTRLVCLGFLFFQRAPVLVALREPVGALNVKNDRVVTHVMWLGMQIAPKTRIAGFFRGK